MLYTLKIKNIGTLKKKNTKINKIFFFTINTNQMYFTKQIHDILNFQKTYLLLDLYMFLYLLELHLTS